MSMMADRSDLRGAFSLGSLSQALRESEARYLELFATSTDGIVAVDLNGHFLDCNPAYLRLIGYDSIDELSGKTFWDITPPEYQEIEKEKFHPAIENGFGAEYDKEYLTRNGERIPVAVRSWPRRDLTGKVVGAWAIVRDLTLVKLMDQKINNLAQQELMSEVAATINHEVRNPLTTVRGFLQLFTGDDRYGPQQKELFQLMISELDSAVQIVSDLLELARPSGPRRKQLYLDEQVSSLVKMMEGSAFLHRVGITADVEPNLHVNGDPAQLRQVFLSLFQNAFEAMPDGGHLNIKAYADEQQVLVEISDTGCGIPPEHLPRVGRPFFTTKAGRTGLGLASCQRIVANHHGRIEMQSRLDQGTTVRIFLPASQSCN